MSTCAHGENIRAAVGAKGSGTQAVPDLISRLRDAMYLPSIYYTMRGKASERLPQWGVRIVADNRGPAALPPVAGPSFAGGPS